MAERRIDRWLGPRTIFPIIASLLLAAVLFGRPTQPEDRASGHSSYALGLNGMRGLYEVIAQLGWRTGRRVAPWNATLDTVPVYVVLEPQVAPSATETGALLDAVRRGAAALVEIPSDGPLTDSLGVKQSDLTFDLDADSVRYPGIPWHQESRIARAAHAPGLHFRTYLRPVPRDSADTVPHFPAGMQMLARAMYGAQKVPLIAQRAFGRGSVIVVSDASFLSNSALRYDQGAVLVVRLLEQLDPAHDRAIVFDEYHQGFGQGESLPAVVRDALVHTPPGRVVVQLGVAGLILLLALSVRPIAPIARRSIERRSPFEHVGALSRAYEQIDA
ncbi:MAG: DUF4350 domain-containing protein, partial [Gemmatimonadaceae bacterium]